MVSPRRRKFRAITTAIILAFALIAIVVTGFGTGGFGGLDSLISGGASGSTVVKVDGRSLSETKLTDTINLQFNRARQQQPTLDMATFLGNGAFDQIVHQMIIGVAVQAFGEAQGLSVSPQMVDREIVNVPAFRNVAGQFDENAMRQALRAQNVTEADLRDDVTQSLMQRQLLGPVALGARVPDGVAREYANLLLERRTGAVGVVPAAILAPTIQPSEAQIAAYYMQHRNRFTIPERRVIQYAVIGRDQVAAAARATEPEIQSYYRQNAATYGAHETRNLQSVVLPTQAAALAFAQRVRSGTAFAEVAQGAGFAATDITFANQNRDQFAHTTSPEIAAAAWGAAQGAVVGPLRSPLGYHVVRVDSVTGTAARPIEAVHAEIAAAIEQRKLNDALAAAVTRIEDKISGGANVQEIVRDEHLQLVTTPPLTATGQAVDQPFTMSPDLQPLLAGAFEIDSERPEPVVAPIQENQRYALLGIGRIVPAAPPPLVQIQPQVRAAVIQDMALAQARVIAQSIVDRINHGMPAAQAFAAAQPAMPAPRDVNLRRVDLGRQGQQVPPPLLTLFSLPEGRARLLPAPNNAGWYVVWHHQRTAGDASAQPQLIAATRTEFSRSSADEIAQQFARAIELQSNIRRNEAGIAAVRTRLVGSVAE